MPFFRKKTVVIEARQFDGSNNSAFELRDWIGSSSYWSQTDETWGCTLFIQTLEGRHRADPGDWVIRGVKGEFYPCKPEIFAATYEPANPIKIELVSAERPD
jgi:hypothetical protein